MTNLSQFLSDVPGYFRTNEEETFPWTCKTGLVWYSLLVVENGKIERYGFTSAKSQKAQLVNALIALDGREALLLGVWTGSHRTDLFVLDISKAIERLIKVC